MGTATSSPGIEDIFYSYGDGVKYFKIKLQDNTLIEWDNSTYPLVGDKYGFIQHNFTGKWCGYSSAKYQYCVDDSVYGKTSGCYDNT